MVETQSVNIHWAYGVKLLALHESQGIYNSTYGEYIRSIKENIVQKCMKEVTT